MHPIAPISAAVHYLAWLAGRWIGEDATDRLEEVWTEPHAGMMLEELGAWFGTEDSPHVPGDEFRYRRG